MKNQKKGILAMMISVLVFAIDICFMVVPQINRMLEPPPAAIVLGIWLAGVNLMALSVDFLEIASRYVERKNKKFI